MTVGRATPMFTLVPMLMLCAATACKPSPKKEPPPVPDAGSTDQYVIEIDVDDHGLKALWQAQAPNLKRLINEGTLAYSRVIVPTHSNESNMTLVTGNYPDGHNVPTNSWLDRQNKYQQPFSLAGLGVGNYVFYDQNPLNPAVTHHTESVWSTTHAAGLSNTYVGQLPPWEWGTDMAHFSILDAAVFGITLDGPTIKGILLNSLNYPTDVVSNHVSLDGPPDAGETIEHFTIRDAAEVWNKAVASGTKPPRYMFVWAFIALDDDPTSTYGGDGPQIAAVVDDYDNAIGDLLNAIDNSPYKGQVNIMFTLDHGKVDTTEQVALGTAVEDGEQLAELVANSGSLHHVGPDDYAILNEDGDALIYAKCDGGGTPAGMARQTEISHGLVELIQAGTLQGVDTSRTITWDGYMGTRRLHDYRIESPYQADVIVFPQPGWTLNNVDGTGVPGPFSQTAHPYPYGRHGGFSEDELYVPLIMWGPAFKKGMLVPHPVNHPDVAPTAMKILGQQITTAEGAPINAALVGTETETLADPADMTTARDVMLAISGFDGTPTLTGTAATQAVIIDLAGVSYDAVFNDSVTMPHLQSLHDLAASGVSFDNAHLRNRSWAENEFEMLTGGTPVQDPTGAWLPSADSDPTQNGLPGEGLLQLPLPASGTPANATALTTWRQAGGTPWVQHSLLDAFASVSTAVIGAPDFHLAHISPPASVTITAATADNAASSVSSYLQAHSNALVVVPLGSKLPGDVHSAGSLSAFDALAKAVSDIHTAAPNALLVVTSRGLNDIDDPAADSAGPGTSRHVPLIMVGPNVRAGVISGQPATSADIPATVAFGMGLATHTDFVEGTFIDQGAQTSGAFIVGPSNFAGGHALMRGFSLK
jgi:predicted AlkP superfamily pyrophosphatase or phosphodiesterase